MPFELPISEEFINASINFALWLGVGLTAFAIIMWPISVIVASYLVYTLTLKRKNSDTWSRNMPSSSEEEHLRMDAIGMEWHSEKAIYKNDVHIINNGLNLYGEYYDFGYDKCVIILSGRTESLRYGYFFAIPYEKSGCNVLVVDPRAHGLSDGEFNTVGFEESKDALAWAEFIHNRYGIDKILFHGICIGAAAAIFAITSDNCPDYISGMVAEGMFSNFGESMKNHLRERKKPTFMLYGMINAWMKHYTGHSMNYGPINRIEKMNKPLLMIHSKEDIYSVPENAQKLYDLAPTKNKSLVWYEHGRHSMLRITEPEKYDAAIAEFVENCFQMAA